MARYNKEKFYEEQLRLADNPFIGTLTIRVEKRVNPSNFLHDKASGMMLPVEFDSEVERPVRVYTSPERRVVLNKLSPNSSKLLTWIQQCLTYNEDYFWLNKVRYMEETGVAYNTFKNSREELVKENIICPTFIGKDYYWINPHYFFRGRRDKKYGHIKGVVE